MLNLCRSICIALEINTNFGHKKKKDGTEEFDLLFVDL